MLDNYATDLLKASPVEKLGMPCIGLKRVGKGPISPSLMGSELVLAAEKPEERDSWLLIIESCIEKVRAHSHEPRVCHYQLRL